MENLNVNKILGFPIIQNQQDFVISKFSIKQIFTFTKYTSRLLTSIDEEGKPIYKDNGEFQRQIEQTRANQIANFLIEDPDATFPTNLILHIPKEVILEQKEHKAFVEISLDQKVFDEVKKKDGDIFITIIDGQHRIKGIEIALDKIKAEIDLLQKTLRTGNSSENKELLDKLNKRIQRLKDLENIELVVSFFIDKTLEYQAMIFSTINRTQKRVSQSLVYELFGLNTDDSPQKTAIQVIISLNSHPNSPFYKRIKFYGGNYSKDNSPPLSQASMAKSIINMISESLSESERDRNRSRKELNKRSAGSNKYLPFRKYYANDKDNLISDILFYYFSSVRNNFKDKYGNSLWNMDESGKPQNILHTTVGYDSLLKILVEILQEQNIEIKSTSIFDAYLNKCKNLNLDNLIRYPFNNTGKKILYLDMSLAIWPHNPADSKDNRLFALKEITAD
jgi:DGQHR domain-containing protein